MLRPPTQQFNFHVVFGEDFRVLSELVVSIEVDFHIRIIDLVVRDSIDNATIQALTSWMDGPVAIDWRIGVSRDNIARSHLFSRLTVCEHKMGQSYASSEIALHKVRLRFEDCDTSYA